MESVRMSFLRTGDLSSGSLPDLTAQGVPAHTVTLHELDAGNDGINPDDTPRGHRAVRDREWRRQGTVARHHLEGRKGAVRAKVWFVTGANRALGAETAWAAMDNGYDIAATPRETSAVEPSDHCQR